ncbi:hypothetical protein BG015_006789 [Linnemannia schmuckeri]|uniref:FAD-binding domain-containing protein n=1 Tax=Linnemannia schmuckeri TaxID=64567 RepID=A0A9P5S8X2_9FUNG|nr:hypothetical protein BG015_006789 [Linnemannia schmuckeri]
MSPKSPSHTLKHPSPKMPLPPRPRPKVLIVGAGLGGLMLGILLDKIGVPYHIYERALEVKPLGALMSFSGNVLRLFEQLGMLEEVLSISIPSANSQIYSEDMDLLADLGIPGYESLSGYMTIFFARPDMYRLIRSKVPPQNITMDKKVVSVIDTPQSIKILCSDDTSYEGDILVGADGAYSTIRREMHARLEKKGLLSEADKQDFTVPYVCMVGTTTARDPEKYPELKDSVAHLYHIIGNSTRYSWTTITIPKNRICWSVMAQVKSESEASQLRLSSTEWGPEAAESMIKEVHDFPIKLGGGGGILGDIIDATPPDVVSKVMLEEKLFEQWSHGRIVLIGDGQGAINAMQDALILTNCIYDLPDLSLPTLTSTFKDYHFQRYEHAKCCIASSKLNAKISSGQTWAEKVIRYLVFNFLPKWIQVRTFTQHVVYRPQASFLPVVEDRGSVASLPQKPSWRYQAELDATAAAAAAAAAKAGPAAHEL